MHQHIHSTHVSAINNAFTEVTAAVPQHRYPSTCTATCNPTSSHCIKSLHQVTTSSHYVKLLHQVTTSSQSLHQLSHYVKSLHQVTHYIKSVILQVTASSHYIKSDTTSSQSFFKSLHQVSHIKSVTTSSHYIKSVATSSHYINSVTTSSHYIKSVIPDTLTRTARCQPGRSCLPQEDRSGCLP